MLAHKQEPIEGVIPFFEKFAMFNPSPYETANLTHRDSLALEIQV